MCRISLIRKKQRENIKKYSKGCNPGQYLSLKSVYDVLGDLYARAAYRSTIRRIILRRQAFYINVPTATIDDYIETGRAPDLSGHIQKQKLSYSLKKFKHFKKRDTVNKKATKETIRFFFLGDLIYGLMDCMYEAANKNIEIHKFDPKKVSGKVGRIKKEVRNTKVLLSSFLHCSAITPCPIAGNICSIVKISLT